MSAALMAVPGGKRPRPLVAKGREKPSPEGPRVTVHPAVLNGIAVLVMGVWAWSYVKGGTTGRVDALAFVVVTAIFGGQFLQRSKK